MDPMSMQWRLTKTDRSPLPFACMMQLRGRMLGASASRFGFGRNTSGLRACATFGHLRQHVDAALPLHLTNNSRNWTAVQFSSLERFRFASRGSDAPTTASHACPYTGSALAPDATAYLAARSTTSFQMPNKYYQKKQCTIFQILQQPASTPATAESTPSVFKADALALRAGVNGAALRCEHSGLKSAEIQARRIQMSSTLLAMATSTSGSSALVALSTYSRQTRPSISHSLPSLPRTSPTTAPTTPLGTSPRTTLLLLLSLAPPLRPHRGPNPPPPTPRTHHTQHHTSASPCFYVSRQKILDST